jgi:iturin family lipopeptide synthetase A
MSRPTAPARRSATPLRSPPSAKLKTNIGHLDAAAGVAGLIKTALVVESRILPPSLHFTAPNPAIDFAATPFYVAARGESLAAEETVYAGVSSFGIGGTNAHLVLASPPLPLPREAEEGWHLLVQSARTAAALDQATERLAQHLKKHPDLDIGDVAFTSQVGRRALRHRRMLVCRSSAEARSALSTPGAAPVLDGPAEIARSLAFLFPGQGAQHAGIGVGLYAAEPAFRREVDRCLEILHSQLGFDLGQVFHPGAGAAPGDGGLLARTLFAQPALFTLEYALGRLWMGWGLSPEAMIGHSLGEYVAACIAGVFPLEQGLALVAARGRLMEETAAGAMLAVSLPEDETAALLTGGLCLAAVNGPAATVVSGSVSEVAGFAERATALGARCRFLSASRAFHSPLMDPVREPFRELLAGIALRPPTIPFASNLTGTWITAEQATSPDYWCEHLRRPVRFAAGLGELLAEPGRALLEVGPGSTLAVLARRHPGCSPPRTVLTSLPQPSEAEDHEHLLGTLGKLWLAGLAVCWPAVHAGRARRRVRLPTYPFERRRHWAASLPLVSTPPRREPDVADWLYALSWKRAAPAGRRPGGPGARRWLVVLDEPGLGGSLAARLVERGGEVITVTLGDRFARLADRSYAVNPECAADHEAMLGELAREGRFPEVIVHLGNVSHDPAAPLGPERFDAAQRRGFWSLLHMARAIEVAAPAAPLRLLVLANGVEQVTGMEALAPEKATLFSLCRVLSQEYTNLACRTVDLVLPATLGFTEELVEQVLTECLLPSSPHRVALRGLYRWFAGFERLRPDGEPALPARLRQGGVYVVTGGLGSVGMVLAEYMAKSVQARLVLTRRSPFPGRDDWDGWLAEHGAEDPVAQLIVRLRQLEELGAKVETASIDVADRDAMLLLFERTERLFGPIDGVIHAAGKVGREAFVPVRETTSDTLREQRRAKVDGLLVLAEVLRDRRPDFCLLMSSLSGVLGGLGFAAYAAANGFMDAFAVAERQRDGFPWISVDWDGWDFSGRPAGEREDLVITPAESGKALAEVLALSGPAQVMISTGDLETRAALWVRAAVPQRGSGEPPPPQAERGSPPATEARSLIAEIWRDLLGIEQIAPEDSFFSLGGDSILATRLLARLRQATGISVPLRAVFESPSLAALAAVVAAASLREPGNLSPIPRMPRDREIPLSFGQQRLWFLEQIETDLPPYNTLAPFRVTGALRPDVLGRALSEIVRRHEALRTVFPEVDGHPIQAIAPARDLPLPRVDLAALPGGPREAEMVRLGIAMARQRFDLAAGPLLQVLLLRLAPGEHAIFVSMHHIVCDGWSVEILVHELSVLYSAFARGLPSPLPELRVQYADYAVWQREGLAGEPLAEQLAYWRRQLSGMPDLQLRLDHQRPALPSFRGAKEILGFDEEASRRLRELGQRLGATPFMVTLAAFQILLYHYTGQTDIVVGTNVANRNRPEVQGLIGFFVNSLVLRTDLGGDPGFSEVVRRVREVVLAAFAHQDLPFERVVEEMAPKREPGRHPLFQVLFSFQLTTQKPLDLPEIDLQPLDLPGQSAAFDLLLNLRAEPDRIAGWLEYSTDVLEAATITALLRHFAIIVEHVSEDPEAPISTLSLIADGAEEAELLRAFTEDLATAGLPSQRIQNREIP